MSVCASLNFQTSTAFFSAIGGEFYGGCRPDTCPGPQASPWGMGRWSLFMGKDHRWYLGLGPPEVENPSRNQVVSFQTPMSRIAPRGRRHHHFREHEPKVTTTATSTA